ncbi:hypothetical protein QQG09_08805 [Melissococcus plutonius]|uniref:hypothetical protein n=1 Tax=Melissococcus plutonius TaxID=33970 RepID=UPI0021E53BF3|nr:hypothetical protein [Melissococcus plutonius]MCV2505680.1 hypothetical protein [Melissococcus plutonius]
MKKEKKPYYKRIWFWIIIVFLFTVCIGNLIDGNNDKNQKSDDKKVEATNKEKINSSKSSTSTTDKQTKKTVEKKNNKKNDKPSSIISKGQYNDSEGQKNYQEAQKMGIDSYFKKPENVGKSIYLPNASIGEASKGENLWISASNDPNDMSSFAFFQATNLVNSKVKIGDTVEIHAVIMSPHTSILYSDDTKYPTLDLKEMIIK